MNNTVVMNIGLWTQNNIGPDFDVPKKYDEGKVVFLTCDDGAYEGIEKFINDSIGEDFFSKDRAYIKFDIILNNHSVYRFQYDIYNKKKKLLTENAEHRVAMNIDDGITYRIYMLKDFNFAQISYILKCQLVAIHHIIRKYLSFWLYIISA